MVGKLHSSENPVASMALTSSKSQCGTQFGDIDLLAFSLSTEAF